MDWIIGTLELGLDNFENNISRRFLFACTSALIFLSFTSMSVYTLLDTNNHLSPALSQSLNFVPMISIILAYVGFGLGYGVIPSLLAAELMPVPVRSSIIIKLLVYPSVR